MAKRERISYFYSDNKTNFVGASKDLRDLCDLFRNKQHKHRLENKFLTENGIT